MINRLSIASLTLVAALLAWGGVGFFAWTISADEASNIANGKDTAASFAAGASALRTHALALDVAVHSAQLKEFLNVDVVSVAYLIEAAGKSAGVAMKLGDAVPEHTSTAPDAPLVKSVGFVVEAEGTFAEVMRAAQLLETLPVPSSVTRLDIERTPAAGTKGAGTWHMNAYIRVLTTSDISS